MSNIENVDEVEGNVKSVRVEVKNPKTQETVNFDFLIVMRTFGLKKGCWMTKAIRRLNT